MNAYLKQQKTNLHRALNPSSAISAFANTLPQNGNIQIVDDKNQPIMDASNSSLANTQEKIHELLKEYNQMLIDMGHAVKRSELKQKDLIDLRMAVTYNGKEHGQQQYKHTLPDFLTKDQKIDNTLMESWYHLIPCFNEGVIQLNDARYIEYKILNIDIPKYTLDIRVKDYIRMDNIWQIGVQTTIHYNCHALTNITKWLHERDTFYKEFENDQMMANILMNSIVNFFIKTHTKNSNTINYVDLYQMIPKEKFQWSADQKNVWDNLVINYAKTNIEKLKKDGTSPEKELTKIFTYAVLISNKLLQEFKPKAKRTENKRTNRTIVIDETNKQPRKLVRQVGPISMTSAKPPKLPTEETVIKYKTAVWKSRGGVRRLKNGKLVPFKECIKHRKCLQDTTEDIPTSIIRLTTQTKGDTNGNS